MAMMRSMMTILVSLVVALSGIMVEGATHFKDLQKILSVNVTLVDPTLGISDTGEHLRSNLCMQGFYQTMCER